MPSKTIVQPENVWNPQKYMKMDPTGLPWSHAVKAQGTTVYISGQTSVDTQGNVVGVGDMTAQVRKSISNLEQVVKAAGGRGLEDVVATTWYVTNIDDFYERGGSTVRREMFKKDFPTSTLVEIRRLAHKDYLCEVEAIAVV